MSQKIHNCKSNKLFFISFFLFFKLELGRLKAVLVHHVGQERQDRQLRSSLVHLVIIFVYLRTRCRKGRGTSERPSSQKNIVGNVFQRLLIEQAGSRSGIGLWGGWSWSFDTNVQALSRQRRSSLGNCPKTSSSHRQIGIHVVGLALGNAGWRGQGKFRISHSRCKTLLDIGRRVVGRVEGSSRRPGGLGDGVPQIFSPVN